MAVEIIAEAGVNHGGRLDLAKRLVDAALSAGADAVKFQTFIPDKILRRNDPDFSLIESLALSRVDFVELAKYCADMGIEFITTPGELDSLHFAVEELGVKRIKIGSDDMLNKPLLKSAKKTKLPLIVSTGMATMDEVFDMASFLGGQSARNLTILHCVSLYPCELEEVNLKAMVSMSDLLAYYAIPHDIGYSDHTGKLHVVEAAVALGASLIEAHLMLLQGPPPVDAAVSHSPNRFKSMIQRVRLIEKVLGDGEKKPCLREQEVLSKLRKGSDNLRGEAA